MKSRFLRKEDGSLSIEAVFTIPLLAWVIVATYVFFDAFKQLNVSQKATYTVADMISREETQVDDGYITALHEVFSFIAGQRGPSALRISVVEMCPPLNPGGDPFLELAWSEGRMYDDLVTLDPIQDSIPTLSPGEQLIVVESVQRWEPPFAEGLAASYNFREVALARPRFATKIVFDGVPEPCIT